MEAMPQRASLFRYLRKVGTKIRAYKIPHSSDNTYFKTWQVAPSHAFCLKFCLPVVLGRVTKARLSSIEGEKLLFAASLAGLRCGPDTSFAQDAA